MDFTILSTKIKNIFDNNKIPCLSVIITNKDKNISNNTMAILI